MKNYSPLECNTVSTISNKIYEFIRRETTLLQDRAEGWQFIDCKKLIADVPELAEFFKQHKLLPREAAVVILYRRLDLHIDPAPVTAKINFPVSNNQGWRNYWYSLADGVLESLPKKITQFGAECEDVSQLPETELLDPQTLDNLDMPIVFNSRVPHSVVPVNPVELPRIIASFTFYKEPVELLK
jgi:hypothetical protein